MTQSQAAAIEAAEVILFLLAFFLIGVNIAAIY
jgi:hypothetical protein